MALGIAVVCLVAQGIGCLASDGIELEVGAMANFVSDKFKAIAHHSMLRVRIGGQHTGSRHDVLVFEVDI